MHPLTDEFTAPLLQAVESPAQDTDADSEAVYRFAAQHGRVEPGDAARIGLTADRLAVVAGALERDHLLRWDNTGAVRGWSAVDPRIAAAVQAGPIEREIARRREQIARFADRTDRFSKDFTAARTVERRVTGAAEVSAALRLSAAAAADRVFIGHGGAHGSRDFDDLLALALDLQGSGVGVRLLCQHRGRADLAVRSRLVELIAAGAQVRTLGQLPRQAMVVDATTAVLLAPAEAEAAATVTDDPDTVGFVLDLYEAMWSCATPVDCGADTGYAEVAGDLKRTLVALMAAGFTDEIIARKLSISVRSCRRHIAALLRELGAVSRFQAGINAAGRAELVAAG